jgi:CRISPR-associated protein Cas6/Cse3/CasE subtype I-E
MTTMLHLSRLILDPMSRQVQNELASPYEMHRTLSHAFPGLGEAEFRAARVLFRADDDNGALHLIVQSKTVPDWDAFHKHLNGKRYSLGAPQMKEWQPQFQNGQRLRFRLLANPTYRPFVAKDAKLKKNIERVGLFHEYERLDWLLHRGQREYGFALEAKEVTLRPRLDTKTGKDIPVLFRGKEHTNEKGEAMPLKLDLPCVEIVDLNDGPLRSCHGDRIRRHALPLGAAKNNTEIGAKKPVLRFGAHQFSAARFDGTLQVTDTDTFLKAVENGIGPAKGFGFGLLSLAPARG